MSEQMTLEKAIAVMAACAYNKDANGIVGAWEVIKAHLNAAKGEVDFDTTYHGVMIRKMAEMLSNNEWADLFTGDDAIASLQEQISRLIANKNAAKGEAVAWMVPRIVTFKGVMRTNAPPEFQSQIEGAVSWHPSLIGDAHPVTDKHGVTHKPRPLVYANDPASPDVVRDAELLAFHDYFRDRCEALFNAFGMEAIDLYNAAAMVAREGGE